MTISNKMRVLVPLSFMGLFRWRRPCTLTLAEFAAGALV